MSPRIASPSFSRTLFVTFGVFVLSMLFVVADADSSAAVDPAAQKEQDKLSKETQAKKPDAEAAELAKVKGRLHDLEAEIKELRAAGKEEAAEKFVREARELRTKLERHAAEPGGKKGPEGQKGKGEKHELAEMLERLGAEAKELRAAGKIDAAEKVEIEARKLKEKIGKPADGDGKKKDSLSPDLANKIEAIQNEAAKLRKAGRAEEAEKLMREIAEVKEHHQKSLILRQKEKPVKDGEKAAGKFDLPPEVKEKIERAKRQIEDLRAAGKKDDAEAIAREIEVYVKRLHDETAIGKKDKGPAKAVSHETQDKSKGQDELAAVLRELRNEVNQLREEVADLRRVVKESSQRGEKKGSKEKE